MLVGCSLFTIGMLRAIVNVFSSRLEFEKVPKVSMQFGSCKGNASTISCNWGGVWLVVMVLSVGCGSSVAGGVSPAGAAAKVMELYDANKDSALDADELKKCPPLAASLRNYDRDADGKVAADEITIRLERLFADENNLAGVDLTVMLDGQPLSGATVKLRPAAFLGGELDVAEGVTDETGIARPTIPSEHLPAEFANSPLVQKIPYVVEITHPEKQIPAKYNTASELGFEVDPSARGGVSTVFDLKSK